MNISCMKCVYFTNYSQALNLLEVAFESLNDSMTHQTGMNLSRGIQQLRHNRRNLYVSTPKVSLYKKKVLSTMLKSFCNSTDNCGFILLAKYLKRNVLKEILIFWR